MPSKPLFGSPVAVGISDAVMAMRSVVSAVAEWDDRSAVSSATVQEALRMGMIYLRPTIENPRLGSGEIRANFRPATLPQLNKNSAVRRPANCSCNFRMVARETSTEQQRTVIGRRERKAGGPRLPSCSKQRSNHETRNIGIGDGAGIHGHFRARAVGRRLDAAEARLRVAQRRPARRPDLPSAERQQGVRRVRRTAACQTTQAVPRPDGPVG